MKLLISIKNKTEALEIFKSECDVIYDIKNPDEGSLGANFPTVISDIRDLLPEYVKISATIGDMPNLPGTASLAAYGASMLGVTFVKVGLFGVKTYSQTTFMLKKISESVKTFCPKVKVVAGVYADYKNIESINISNIQKIAKNCNIDGILMDTANKNKTKLFDFVKNDELKEFVNKAHKYDLFVALAGSLDVNDVERIWSTGADIFGVRGAVCEKKDRKKGQLKKELVKELYKKVNMFHSKTNLV